MMNQKSLTNPYPLDLEVCLSVMTTASSISPYTSKCSRSDLSVVWYGRPPTNSFVHVVSFCPECAITGAATATDGAAATAAGVGVAGVDMAGITWSRFGATFSQCLGICATIVSRLLYSFGHQVVKKVECLINVLQAIGLMKIKLKYLEDTPDCIEMRNFAIVVLEAQ